MRVLMLGIDAMSLPFTRAHIDQLPTLKALMARGVLLELKSTGADFPASTWPTFASGTLPGEHGQYFPFQWDAPHLTQRRHSDSAWRKKFSFVPFWQKLVDSGIDSTILDVAPLVNGNRPSCRQIVNWSFQDTSHAESSDPELLAELRRRFGTRPIGREVPVPKKRARCEKVRDQAIESLARKGDAILWLMDRNDWRFFLAGIYEAHRAGHNLWPIDASFASDTDHEALLEVYKALDTQLQRIIEHAVDDRTTLILFSLHGMGPNRVQDHFLPKILSRLNARYLAERGFGTVAKRKPNLMALLRKLVPSELQIALAGLLGERVQDWVVNRTVLGGIDWSCTPVFQVSSGGEGMLRLNIKGREAKGFFDPDSPELQEYVAWLKDSLLEIRVAGSNEPLIAQFERTGDIFPGPLSHMLPDILLKWGPDAPVERIYSKKIGEIHARLGTGRGGNHTGGSFVQVSGPGACGTAVHDIAHIKDIGAFATTCFEPTPPGLAAAA